MHKTLIGFDKNLAVLNHHDALLGTFFSSLQIHAEHLAVTTNVNSVLDWEYILPFNGVPEINHHNIYTNKTISTPHFLLKFKDSWLVRSISSVEEKFSPFQWVEVKNCSEMLFFLDGFTQIYFGDDKNQTCGSLSMRYHDALFNSYRAGQSKLSYFYVLDNNQCLVAISAIAIIKPYCFSYCIGVIPAFRGKKISTFLLDHHGNYAIKADCQFQVLQTEQGSFVENIYLNNHFTLFETMHYYVLSFPRKRESI